jgi:lichenan operon transcriptional antiterminator
LIHIVKRQKEIIRYILRKNTYVTGKEISLALLVSDRTIRIDIKSINALEDIIHSTNQGYFIPREKIKSAKDIVDRKHIPVEQMDRTQYILKKLILSKSVLDIYDIAEELYISECTIEKDIKMVSNFFKEGGYKLAVKKYGEKFSLEGEEKEKRFLLSSLLFEELKDNIFSLRCYQYYFNYNLEDLKKRVVEIIEKNTFYIRDMEEINFLIHIAIAMERVEKNNILQRNLNIDEKSKEYQIAIEIGRAIEENFKVKFPKVEIQYVAFLLLGKKVVGGNFSSKIQLYKDIPVEYIKVTEEILRDICKEFGINFMDDENLLVGLTLHMQLMHERIKKENPIKSISAPDLKINYPIIFEIAVFTCKKFYEKMGMEVKEWQESEISFIALHFGASYEGKFKRENKLNVALVCPSGYTTSGILLKKIKNTYGDSINIVNTYSISELDEVKNEDVDYIFTTVDLGNFFPIPFIIISSFLSNKDFKNIYDVLNKEVKKKDLKIEGYFDSRFFYQVDFFKNEVEAIQYMSRRLLEEDIVEESYEKMVIEREKIASTAFDNLVAMPHAIELNARKTLFSVAVLKKPMNWKGQKIQLILMSAIKKGERKTLNHFMNHIAEILDNPLHVNELIASNSYEEFIERLNI